MAEERPRSPVVPVLVAALICDTAVADPGSGKKSLVGIFDTIHVSKFPTQRPMSVYVKLTDAEGFYKMEFRYVRVSSGEVLAKAEGDVQVKSRIASSDFFFSFPPLPIPAEGRFEFQVWANDVFLGGTFIDAVPRAQT